PLYALETDVAADYCCLRRQNNRSYWSAPLGVPMSQFARHPAYLPIEDALDAIGQKWRGLLIVRGALLWAAGAAICSFAAGLGALFAGPGTLTWLIFIGWLFCLATGLTGLVIRPLLMRPKRVEIARLIESRIPDLHNGLTNGVLLAQADDLQKSPWLD